jgi:hypothetical protein
MCELELGPILKVCLHKYVEIPVNGTQSIRPFLYCSMCPLPSERPITIVNSSMNAVMIPGNLKMVAAPLNEDAPYYVMGGSHCDMRTIYIEHNVCFDCHRGRHENY